MHYQYGGRDRYNFPGGKPDTGETVPEALKREWFEELGVQATVGDLACIAETHVGGRDMLHMVYWIETIEGEVILNADQTKALDVVWIDIEQMIGKDFYPAIEFWIDKGLRSKGDRIPVDLKVVNQPWY
ncbi:MAG: NUDIX hydrolase [Magnetococcales bacterium]|nr:NUDIX hydrolase [Magnetococcales bacterium]